MIGYGRQSIDESDIAAVAEVLRSDWLTCGPAVDHFEACIAEVTGAEHAVAVANGTSALRLLYQVAGIGPGIRVGIPAITFVATASQALLLGAEVVLLDVDPETLLLTPAILDDCPYALDWVVPVHVAGRQCDMAGISEVAERHGMQVLEDAAHAFGSTNDHGSCGDGRHSAGAIFSFHPVKNISCGEGGAVVTNSSEWAKKLRQLRHHGVSRGGFTGPMAERDSKQPWYHEFADLAGNERLSDIHAALGASQCQRLETFKQQRAAIVRRYQRGLAGHPGVTPPSPANGQQPFWHLAVHGCDWGALGCDRGQLFATLREQGFAPQVHYMPLHYQPVCSGLRGSDRLAGAETAYQSIVSLPCYPGLQTHDQDRLMDHLMGMVQ